MTMKLKLGTVPDGLELKTFGIAPEEVIFLGDYRISLKDFVVMVHYVLTNTDLLPNDPRRQLVEYIRGMKEVPGYAVLFGADSTRTRFESDIPLFSDEDANEPTSEDDSAN